MTSSSGRTFETIAHHRSLEAELASEQVADDPTADAHRHAAHLHREAATWRTKADHHVRALHHQTWADTHNRLAARIDKATAAAEAAARKGGQSR